MPADASTLVGRGRRILAIEAAGITAAGTPASYLVVHLHDQMRAGAV